MAGIAAEFLPWPTVVPYLLHIGLALIVVPLVWTVPEPRSTQSASRRRSFVPTSLITPHYLPVVAYAPWVFGSATTAFVFLPAQLSEHLRHPVLVAGLCALLTMGSGVVIQQLAGRIRVTSFHSMALAAVGMALCLAVLAAAQHGWAVFLLPIAAIIMGSSYGIGMLSGLAETQTIADAEELGAATGVFYSLTYLGFFAPFILSLLGPAVGYSTAFVIGLTVAVATAVALRLHVRGNRG